MTYNVAPGTLTQQPQRPVRVSKASGLAHGIGEVIVPHLGVSLVRRLPHTSRGSGIRQIPTPAGVALGMTAFSNSSGVTALEWPHHGFRLTPPCTYGCVAVLNSSSALNLISMFTSNNSGYRIRASGAAFIGEVTRSGATVTVTDPSTVALGSVHTVLFVITATTLTLYVDGVSVATGAHSAYSAGSSLVVNLAGTSSGGVANGGGCLMAASWPRALTAEDAATWAAQPWSILEDEDDVWTSSAGGVIVLAGADATQANTADTGAIVQLHQVLATTGDQANTGGTGAIAQTHVLAGADGTQTNTSSTADLTQQLHVLAGAPGSQANTADDGALVQTHQLAGAAGTQGNTAGTGAIAQTHQLAAADGTQANEGSTADLGAGSLVLAGAPGSQANTGGAGVIGQVHVLVAAPSVQDNVAGASAIVQRHVLAGAAGVQANGGPAGAIYLPTAGNGTPKAIVMPELRRFWSAPADARTWVAPEPRRAWLGRLED